MPAVTQKYLSATIIALLIWFLLPGWLTTLPTVQAQGPWPCDTELYIAELIDLGTGPQSRLHRVVRDTGAFVTIGDSGLPTPSDYNAMGYNPADNFMYSVHETSGTYYRIGDDAVSVNIGTVGAPPNGGQWWNATFWYNTAQARWEHIVLEGDMVANHALLRVLPNGPGGPPTVDATVALNGVAPIPGGAAALAFGDIAAHPITGVIYGSPDNDRALYTIDPLTGTATRIGPTVDATGNEYYAAALYFDAYGQLWGYADVNPPAAYNFVQLIRIDITTGAVTVINAGAGTTRSDGASCATTIIAEKTVAPPSVPQGSTVTYTYRLRNNLETPATINFQDVMPPLPDERVFVAGTAVVSNGTGTITFPDAKTLSITGLTIPAATLGVGGSPGFVTITVDVNVGNTPPSTVLNQATLSNLPAALNLPNVLSDYPPTDGYPDATPLQITAATAIDLAISKDDGTATYTPGGTLVYTIVVTNVAGVDANGATVTDTFPAQLQNVSWTCVASAGSACTAGPVNGDINDTVNVLAGGTLTYTVTANVDPAAAGDIINTATISHPNDTNPANNTATDVDTPPAQPAPVPQPPAPVEEEAIAPAAAAAPPAAAPAAAEAGLILIDPAMVKLGDPQFALPGEVVVWTITVTNLGSATATGVVVSDPIDTSFFVEIIDATTGKGTVTISDLHVTYALGDLAPSETVTMTLTTRVRRDISPPRTGLNVATLTANELPEPRTASASVSLLSLPPTGYPQTTPTTLPGWTVGVAGGLAVALAVVLMRRRRR